MFVILLSSFANWQCFSPSCFDHVLLYPERGTIAELYHARDTFEFSQGLVTKNQPMIVPVKLSERLGI